MTTQTSIYPASGEVPHSWRFSALDWAILAFALVTATVPFLRVLTQLLVVWGSPEYSHCVIIPLVSAFLVWRERAALTRINFHGSWLGFALLIGGAGLWAVGELSTVWTIEQYGFLLTVYGLVLALVGPEVFRRLWMAMLILIFTIPFPVFFTNSLSLHLQLLSSALGVAVIRLFDIPVYLDGNVIDLGMYKLQVAEACSGLRYLFPLMTLAFIVTYFFRARFWKRAVLFLASIPVAVLMNSLRIGLIGVSVDYWGQKMAEGVLHYFEGWVVFMVSMGLLLLLAALLVRLGRHPMRLRDALLLDLGPAAQVSRETEPRKLPAPFLAATVVTTLGAVLAPQMQHRAEIQPVRDAFVDFPMQLDSWTGQRSTMGAVYLNQLKLSDYLYATYERGSGLPVNVWVAYYDSQRKGDSTHSPASCLPGGGWQFQSFAPRTLDLDGASTLRVNRALIVEGADRELMYYWFPQRGRDITSEYMLKWYLLWDAITRTRTDGALVRLIVPIPQGASVTEADRQLTAFARTFVSELPQYVPN